MHPMLLHIVVCTKNVSVWEWTLSFRSAHVVPPSCVVLISWPRNENNSERKVCVHSQTRVAGLRWRCSNPPPHRETFPLGSSVLRTLAEIWDMRASETFPRKLMQERGARSVPTQPRVSFRRLHKKHSQCFFVHTIQINGLWRSPRSNGLQQSEAWISSP
jgi:hypothetical protein